MKKVGARTSLEFYWKTIQNFPAKAGFFKTARPALWKNSIFSG
jgi:hypothetical protein